MPPEALRAELLDLVEGTTGIKGVELALALAERCVERGHEIPSEGINAAMRNLVAEGRVVEVEYLVAETPYRVKSFYLPRGSEVRPLAA